MNILQKIQRNIPLRDYCTLRIGGEADYFVDVQSVEEMRQALSYARQQQLPFFILGKGSNCLFHDEGLHALVIRNRIQGYHRKEGRVTVGAGHSFAALGARTAREGWTGLEFASGIPGSVGGAVYMNAGANGHETAEVLEQITYVTAEGECLVIQREDLSFGYRFSSLQERRGVIAEVQFVLQPSREAKSRQLKMLQQRTDTQPYGEHSAGCIFRNPPGDSAGRLIDQAGCKGLRVGDAEVSFLHANFFINRGLAKHADFLQLIDNVREKVKEHSGVELQLEVRCIDSEGIPVCHD